MTENAGGSLTLTLDGTNQSLTVPLVTGTVGPAAADISKLYAKLGIFTFDIGYGATAACESAITYIDGDEGILLHRGYPIDQLAEHSSFSRSRLSADERRTAEREAEEGVRARCDDPHHAARAAAQLLQRLPP